MLRRRAGGDRKGRIRSLGGWAEALLKIGDTDGVYLMAYLSLHALQFPSNSDICRKLKVFKKAGTEMRN